MFLNDPMLIGMGALVGRLQQYPELVALNNGRAIADANIFEFDVQPYGNFISIDYVFASDEWPHNSCDSGADVMAIMLSGPGISGEQNIALLPGSNTPVTTKTVFPAGTTCHPEMPGQASPWYVDNTGGQNVIYNGFTKVLRAAAIVQPCQTYHIRVMVADGVRHPYDTALSNYAITPVPPIDTASSNTIYDWSNGTMADDAGVFLKMGSLRSTDTVRLAAIGGLSQSADHPYALRGCFNGKLRLSVSDSLPLARTFNLHYSGSAVSGVDYQALPATVTLPAFAKYVDIPVTVLPGNQDDRLLTVRVQNPYGSCQPGYQAYLDTAELQILSQYPVSVSPADTGICQGCSVQLHTIAEPDISYNYVWSPALGLSSTSIANPVATPPHSTVYTLNISGSNGAATCALGTATATIQVGNVGITDKEDHGSEVWLHPNPFSNSVRLSISNSTATALFNMDVYNLLGQRIISTRGNVTELNERLNRQMPSLASGAYWIQIQGGDFKAVRQVSKQ